MSVFSSIIKWVRKLRKNGSSPDALEGLREFVYLDEVSLYSLCSSFFGPLATQYTDSQMTSLEREVEGGAKVTAGLAEVSTRASSLITSNQASQVLRKATVQSTFKDFFDQIENRLMARLILDPDEIPEFDNPELDNIEAWKKIERNKDGGTWVINGSSLIRGHLVEMAVELEAEPTFRVSAIASLVVKIIRENSLFEFGVGKELKNIEAVSQVLENLIDGLVPVQGRVIDYKVLCTAGHELIVHNNLIEKLPLSENYTVLPVYLVGVAEQSLFWKDVRRVLFSKSQYQALCRISQSGLQKTWSPIKLVSVLEEIDPQISKQINMIGSEALETLDTGRVVSDQADASKKKALLDYSNFLAEHLRQDNPLAESSSDCEPLSDWDDIENMRKDFGEITNIFEEEFQVDIDHTIAASLREKALNLADYNMFGDRVGSIPNAKGQLSNKHEKRYLDTELIAVYW